MYNTMMKEVLGAKEDYQQAVLESFFRCDRGMLIWCGVFCGGVIW